MERIAAAAALGRDEVDGQLVPEIVLPSQFADPLRNETSRPPEHRLMRAILEDAIRCYQRDLNGPDRRSQRLFRETEDWFASDDTSWPFSFATICVTLDIDPEYIRVGLRQWRSRQAPERRNTSWTTTLRVRPVIGSWHQVTAARRRPRAFGAARVGRPRSQSLGRGRRPRL